MQYKTIVLHLLEQHPEIYDPLRRHRRMLRRWSITTRELRPFHDAWTEILAPVTPDHDPSRDHQRGSGTALKDLMDRLPAGSPRDDQETLHHPRRGDGLHRATITRRKTVRVRASRGPARGSFVRNDLSEPNQYTERREPVVEATKPTTPPEATNSTSIAPAHPHHSESAPEPTPARAPTASGEEIPKRATILAAIRTLKRSRPRAARPPYPVQREALRPVRRFRTGRLVAVSQPRHQARTRTTRGRHWARS